MPALVYTSVLLRLRDAAGPAHVACRAAHEPAQVSRYGICVCAQVSLTSRSSPPPRCRPRNRQTATNTGG